MGQLDAAPSLFKKSEVVSAERYLEILRTQRDNIASVRVVPVSLGNRSGGQFHIVWKRPKPSLMKLRTR